MGAQARSPSRLPQWRDHGHRAERHPPVRSAHQTAPTPHGNTATSHTGTIHFIPGGGTQPDLLRLHLSALAAYNGAHTLTFNGFTLIQAATASPLATDTQ